jgi:ferredoxin
MRAAIKVRRSTAILLAIAAAAAIAMGWIYQVDPSICNGCALCISHCPTGALYMEGPNAVIDPELCDACGECLPFCIRGAIYRCWYEGIGEGTVPPGQATVGPNPTTGPVLLTGGTPEAGVTAADMSGRTVRSCRADAEGCAVLDLRGLPAGLYMIFQGEAIAGTVLLLGTQDSH